MTDFKTEYVFCKDNRFVLSVECLFAKPSTANMRELSSWSSALFFRSNSSSALKQHTQIKSVLAHTLKVAILTSYKKLSVGFFLAKTSHTHSIIFKTCKKEHNRSPLNNDVIQHLFSSPSALLESITMHMYALHACSSSAALCAYVVTCRSKHMHASCYSPKCSWVTRRRRRHTTLVLLAPVQATKMLQFVYF